MTKKKSHFQNKEPIFEPILQKIRFSKIKPHIFKDTKVLDLGCGYNASLLHFFSNEISEGVGVDVSIDKSKETRKIKLKTKRLDKELKLPKNHFDLVTSLAVTEHLENPLPMYKTAFKSLKPKGKFILTTPSPSAKPILEFLSFKLGVVSKQEIADHKKYYVTEEIYKLLEKAGFNPKKIKVSLFLFGVNTFALAEK